MGVSGLVLTLNEEKDIEYCLKSLQWCDEILVIDSYSSDNTVDIAEELGAKVFQKKVEGNSFDQLRSFGLDKASNDWVFVLDADEVCPKELSDKLIDIKNQEDFDCVKIPRKNYSNGKWRYYGIWPDYQRRFFKKRYVDYGDRLHSALEVDEEARTIELEPKKEYALKHFTSTGIHDRIDKINKFTSINAKSGEEDYKPIRSIFQAFKAFGMQIGKRIIYKKGYKRGYEAFIEASYAPISIMLTEFKKWQLQKIGDEGEIYEKYNEIRETELEKYD